MDTVWVGESGMNGEDSISTCTLFGVRWMLGDTLLCSTGNCLGSCDDLEGGDIWIIMAHSVCCRMVETNTTL